MSFVLHTSYFVLEKRCSLLGVRGLLTRFDLKSDLFLVLGDAFRTSYLVLEKYRVPRCSLRDDGK